MVTSNLRSLRMEIGRNFQDVLPYIITEIADEFVGIFRSFLLHSNSFGIHPMKTDDTCSISEDTILFFFLN